MLLHGFTDPQTAVEVDCVCNAEIVYLVRIESVLGAPFSTKRLRIPLMTTDFLMFVVRFGVQIRAGIHFHNGC